MRNHHFKGGVSMKRIASLFFVACLVVAMAVGCVSPRAQQYGAIGAIAGGAIGALGSDGRRSNARHIAGAGLLGAAAGAIIGTIADEISPPVAGGVSAPPVYGNDGDSAYWQGYHQEKQRMAREEARRQEQAGREAARMGW